MRYAVAVLSVFWSVQLVKHLLAIPEPQIVLRAFVKAGLVTAVSMGAAYWLGEDPWPIYGLALAGAASFVHRSWLFITLAPYTRGSNKR